MVVPALRTALAETRGARGMPQSRAKGSITGQRLHVAATGQPMYTGAQRRAGACSLRSSHVVEAQDDPCAGWASFADPGGGSGPGAPNSRTRLPHPSEPAAMGFADNTEMRSPFLTTLMGIWL